MQTMRATTTATVARSAGIVRLPRTRSSSSRAGAKVSSRSRAAMIDGGVLAPTAGGLVAVAGVAAALVAGSDPEKRRKEMAQTTGGDEMESVKNYFDGTGFERWQKIYGETDEVNKVQLDIRTGHAETVDKVLRWVDEEGGTEGVTVCDCGCGTGSLAIPLAQRGADVYATDISASMCGEASSRAKAVGGFKTEPKFEVMDLESVSGKYHTVACLDVFIHYPQDKADEMVNHLSSLASDRLIVSFAPLTPYYAVLKRIGELAPGKSKATRAYLHAEDDVEKALNAAGWKVVKKEMTATNFYFSRLFEAVPL